MEKKKRKYKYPEPVRRYWRERMRRYRAKKRAERDKKKERGD